LHRAGKTGRGVGWFVAIQCLAIGTAIALAFEQVPVSAGLGGLGVSAAVYVVMLVDSFRPGRLGWRSGVAFVGLALLCLVPPPPASFIARAFTIPTRAMSPTLRGSGDGTRGDHVIANLLAYRGHLPERGDIIVFRTRGLPGWPDHAFQVKRVVGLPGEELQLRDGALYAGGKRLGSEHGLPPIPYTPLPRPGSFLASPDQRFTVPPDHLFVMGDNAATSLDSRQWGALPRGSVYGKVTRIYYPLDRIGIPRYAPNPRVPR
jgi:signal peptidase I